MEPKVIIVFTKTRQWTLSWTRSISPRPVLFLHYCATYSRVLTYLSYLLTYSMAQDIIWKA